MSVKATADELFDHNPDVVRDTHWDLERRVHYDDINRCNQEPIHFMEAMCRGLADVVRRPVRLSTNRPYLVLSDEEKGWSGPLLEIAPEPTPFAVICCGGKSDYTTKIFGPTIGQEVVDHFAGRIRFVQTGASRHVHWKLRGVADLVDKTTVRQLAQVVSRADFAVGGVTLLMHVAAALQKPYVAMLGGREPRPFTSYPTQIDLGAHGCLSCCRTASCWRSRVVPLKDGSNNDRSLCEFPVLQAGGEHVAKCHALVGSRGIIEAVERLVT